MDVPAKLDKPSELLPKLRSSHMPEQRRDLKSRWQAGEQIYGIFVRSTNEEVFDTLGLTHLDLVVLDAEHGNFDRERLSRCIHAAEAAGIPALIRLPDGDEKTVQFCVNIGAQGVVIPHVNSVEDVAALAHFTKTKAVERAFAGAGRASLQRTADWEAFKADRIRRFVFMAQLDEPECLKNAEAVAAVDGVDGLFLGAIGFGLAQQGRSKSSTVENELAKICGAARSVGRPVGISLPESRKAREWYDRGVSMFVVDSDLAILRKGIERRLEEFRSCML
jgi:2-keto-3-deoxy-L-rhamnonate aldolase RhmA